MKEYKDLTTDSSNAASSSSEPMFTAGPIKEDDFFEWEALITGPEGTPFVSRWFR
jgi:ubiquitin-conjugating enzyme E2 G2